MINKYKEYAKHVNCDDDVQDWISDHLNSFLEKNEENQAEIEHILDYMASDKRPKRISKMSYDQAKSNADKWNKALIKKGNGIDEKPEDVEVIKDFGDGFRIVKLVGENAFKREGFLMRHCVASYYRSDADIYSLRDEKNMPHATMEHGKQIKGKGNGSINPKYAGYIISFLQETGMTAGDFDMRNLGYTNLEEIVDELDVEKSKLYDGKFLFEGNKPFSVDGEEYVDLKLWRYIPILSVKGDFDISFNFDLPEFLNKAIGKIKDSLSCEHDSGDYANIGSSGNHDQIGSSGDYANIGSSGRCAQIANSGNHDQIGSSGDHAQIANSGDYANIGSSGRCAQIANSGSHDQIGSSGDHAQIANSGDYDKIGSSGRCAQIANSGSYAQISMTGDKSIATCSGICSCGKVGKDGCLVLTRWSESEGRYRVSVGYEGENLKYGVWYRLDDDGNFIEC